LNSSKTITQKMTVSFDGGSVVERWSPTSRVHLHCRHIAHTSGGRRIVTLEARSPPLLVVETKEKEATGDKAMKLNTKTTIIQLAGLPLFFPNPLSVQLSFKGMHITILFPLTSQRDAYSRLLFKASKNMLDSSSGGGAADDRSTSMDAAVYVTSFAHCLFVTLW
jgi:hypothetical protein